VSRGTYLIETYHLKAMGLISATICRAQPAEMTSVFLSIYLSIYLSVCLTISLSIYLSICLTIYLWLYSSLLDLGRFFSFLILYTVGRTPWTGDHPVARPLLAHRTTQTQNKLTHIHALSGIRTHDPSFSASEDSSCLRPRGHCDRRQYY
jgi:hypothetical protein